MFRIRAILLSRNPCRTCPTRPTRFRRLCSLVDSSTVAENSESCLTCLCSIVTYGVECTSILAHRARRPGPQYFAKGPIHQPPNDYVATCHKVFKMHYKLYVVRHGLSTVATVLLMNFWSCKLANLRNQKSFSCADNDSIAYICIGL